LPKLTLGLDKESTVQAIVDYPIVIMFWFLVIGNLKKSDGAN